MTVPASRTSEVRLLVVSILVVLLFSVLLFSESRRAASPREVDEDHHAAGPRGLSSTSLDPLPKDGKPGSPMRPLEDPPGPALVASAASTPAPQAPARLPPLPQREVPSVPKADMTVTQWGTVHVQDEQGRGVFSARVTVKGYRSEFLSGALYPPREGEHEFTTDANGNTRIEWWEWADEYSLTSGLCLQVSHPEFATVRAEWSVNAPTPIVLPAGCHLIVGAVTKEGKALSAFDVLADHGTNLPSSAWITRTDGRKEVSAIGAGKHVICVEHQAESGLLYGEPQEFELAPGEVRELHFVVARGVRVTGALDEDVPRPIREGHVALFIHRGSYERSGQDHLISRAYDVPIGADGTFSVGGVPAGTCEVFVICDGWSSKCTTPAGDVADGREEDLQRAPLDAAEPFVVKMQRTGLVEIQIRAADGGKLPQVMVGVSPNVCSLSGCGLVPWGEWLVPSDANGLAVIENVPPGTMWVGAVDEHYQMSPTQLANWPEVNVKPGETARMELVLIRR